jgi:FimV-like protein
MVETLSAETRYRVRSSDNVNTIVQRHYPNSGLSKGQLLVGILIKNPRAFKGGNVNFLLRGKRLRLPEENYFRQISSEKAGEVLSEHVRYFRFGITGDLPIPTLSEMEIEAENTDESADIVRKQKNQNKKIDKLQQESLALKKQLEILLKEKNKRDQRLLELENSLKQSLNVDRNLNGVENSVNALGVKESDEESQKALNKTKNKLGKTLELDKDLIQKADALENKVIAIVEIKDNAKQIILDPPLNILSKFIWVPPLILLALFLFYIFAKKKRKPQADESVKINKAGYIETAEGSTADFQENINKNNADEFEESSLETSVKLDVARAYIEAEDTESALDILTEIMEEGSDEQRQQAHDLLEKISPQ